MGEMITKPDANPIIFAACNLFLFGAVGYFLMGQQKKAMITAGIWFASWICLGWLGIGALIAFAVTLATAYDAYLLGQKLQAGESIGMNENGLEFLNAIFKD